MIKKFKISERNVIGIDASRNRSGGAQAHLIGILSEMDPVEYGVEFVHVWSFRALLDKIPDRQFIIKHNPIELERSLLRQLFWQANSLSCEAKKAGCDIIFSTDSSTVCDFKPMVVLSQDLLSYEPGMMRHYGFGLARLRLLAILVIQNLAFRRSAGVIFLTRYSANLIQKSCGALSNYVIIPHGVDPIFKKNKHKNEWPSAAGKPIQFLYVSNADMYKNQWCVVEAVSILSNRGYNVKLTLVGGGSGPAYKLAQDSILKYDPAGTLVEQKDFLLHSSLAELYAAADLFIFASSCENMPVTLIEAMSAGLPIACSERGPMPEVLRSGGIYFDPVDPISIANAIEKIMQSNELRESISDRSYALSEQYNWKRCADETLTYIVNVLRSP
ncbi:glycosyltransferase family 4 protein [Shewanella sp.]|uniref:glycosyltransferase family 4 protein n=1 Tax=Shewanella sp. TaxID=50422 RepID=UPI0040472B45